MDENKTQNISPQPGSSATSAPGVVAPQSAASANAAATSPVASSPLAPKEIFKLGGEEKKGSVLGRLLGDKFKNLAAKQGGSLLGAAIGAQMAQDSKMAQSRSASIADLLGAAPVFDPAAIEREHRQSIKRSRNVFYAAVFFAFAVFGYFQFNLNPNISLLTAQFGQNFAQKFEQGNVLIKKTQTDINIIQYRIARVWLDVVNGKIDAFTTALAVTKNDKITLAQRNAAQAQADKLAGEIKQGLGAVKVFMVQELGIDTYSIMPVSTQEREAEFAKLLKESLVAERDSLRGAAANPADKAKPGNKDVRAIESVLRLVENKKVRAIIRDAQVKDMSNEDLAVLISKVRAEGIDDFALLEKLKTQRIDWASLINNIHDVVRSADPHYGAGLFKTFGGFLFSSYSFDSKTNRVSISGVTRTTDSKTFSFISSLVDAIEKSPYFKDIDFRSFSKTRDESGDFSAGINLEFGIENNNQ